MHNIFFLKEHVRYDEHRSGAAGSLEYHHGKIPGYRYVFSEIEALRLPNAGSGSLEGEIADLEHFDGTLFAGK
jgi:hypothetical protein